MCAQGPVKGEGGGIEGSIHADEGLADGRPDLAIESEEAFHTSSRVDGQNLTINQNPKSPQVADSVD